MSVAVYVVRHGDAEARDRWAGNDLDRPLTGRGLREARALVDRFDIGPLGQRSHELDAPKPEPKPTQLLSSSAERCLATLRPLGGACGLHVATADFLAEGSDAAQAMDHLIELATHGGVTVTCTHGDVIWGIVELLDGAGVSLTGPLEVKKGSIWVFECDAGAITSARYVPPGKV